MAAQEMGVKYTILANDGTQAVFNDPTDPAYVGMLTEITGLDSPEVRESSDDMIQADGGIHGDFFYGRRPITMSGIILNPASAVDRNAKMERLSRATNAMRLDSGLYWVDSTGVNKYCHVRRQQPLRFAGNWQKTFQLQLVAADPRIYSVVLNGTGYSSAQVINLITNPNAEVDTTGWSVSGGTATLGRDNWAEFGSASFYFTGSVTSNDASMFSNAWAHTAGQPLSAAATINVVNAFNDASNYGRIIVQWDNGGSTFNLGTALGPTISSGTGIKYAQVVNAIAPAGTTQARLRILGNTSGADSFDWRVDSVIATKTATVHDYFDGGFHGCRWSGTAHNSTSTIDGEWVLTNAGNADSYPVIYLTGPANGADLANRATHDRLITTNNTVAGNILIVDNLSKTATYNGVNKYSTMTPGSRGWIKLRPGTNIVRYSATSGSASGGGIHLAWRDAWL